MARINWKGSAPYEYILGKETGEKIYTLMEYLGVNKKHEALRFAIDFTCKELIEKPFKPAKPVERTAKVEAVEKLNVYKCSECGQYMHRTAWSNPVKYCANCGARLEWEV